MCRATLVAAGLRATAQAARPRIERVAPALMRFANSVRISGWNRHNAPATTAITTRVIQIHALLERGGGGKEGSSLSRLAAPRRGGVTPAL